ncbi:MAG: glutamine--fructose-6-phosphate transaminase (isomerizing) [Phycisphaerae bacterium]|nr:glutamine--fructose-6-phosphate transaminase (isomerizing) [Phycisphaerae bacterium]MCZ2399498.1 glutamine--fructose-6-phosphate transaminase (isomerizing) [Phycisphaerae bacterium]NUQ50584.1 glutamine--fructose-6-phosphate transaminase (isomerizing) [Phycisphaerae bacterium]
MCGIVAYIGEREACPIVLEGIKRLDYRGYDSAGIAVVRDGRLVIRRSVGRISALEEKLDHELEGATLGMAHTRWATHGGVTEPNAHPHTDRSGKLAIVHNGIIENYRALKAFLAQAGLTFESQTDTEILAKLIGYFYEGKLEDAVRKALREVRGTFGIAALHADEPGTIVAARRGSPLIVGIGDGEYVVASDAAAIVQHTSQVIYLSDNEVAIVTRDGFRTTTLDAAPVSKDIEEVEYTLRQLELGGHQHFMAKEIFEQPESLRNCMRGRLDLEAGRVVLGGLTSVSRELIKTKRIILTACGTAWHAGLVGEYLIEQLARVPCETEYASEFRYRNPIIEDGTTVLAISQSGETIDTLAALREGRERGALALGIVNSVGSTIARETDAGVYLHVGPEIGVASTKAFTGQLTVLAMIAAFLGRRRHLSHEECFQYLSGLAAIPDAVEKALQLDSATRQIAAEFVDANNWLYLGRGLQYPVALEGALKLKEISYIHAEGLPAAEMKHGPIALISEDMPVVVLAPRDHWYEKVLGNINEVRSRGGRVIAIASEGDHEIADLAEHVLYVPDVTELLQPLVTVIPLQMLAYHAAVLRGCDVDKPRNLAKAVTVE